MWSKWKKLRCYGTVILKHWKLPVRFHSYIWLWIYFKIRRMYVLRKYRTKEFLNENFCDELIYQMIRLYKKTRQASISRAFLPPHSLHTWHFSCKILAGFTDSAKTLHLNHLRTLWLHSKTTRLRLASAIVYRQIWVFKLMKGLVTAF